MYIRIIYYIIAATYVHTHMHTQILDMRNYDIMFVSMYYAHTSESKEFGFVIKLLLARRKL